MKLKTKVILELLVNIIVILLHQLDVIQIQLFIDYLEHIYLRVRQIWALVKSGKKD